MLLMIITCRNRPGGGVATVNEIRYDGCGLSPVLVCFLPRPPDSPPPPDESTTYESVLTTSTPTDITDFNEDVTIVCDVKGDDTAVEDNTEDDSLT